MAITSSRQYISIPAERQNELWSAQSGFEPGISLIQVEALRQYSLLCKSACYRGNLSHDGWCPPVLLLHQEIKRYILFPFTWDEGDFLLSHLPYLVFLYLTLFTGLWFIPLRSQPIGSYRSTGGRISLRVEQNQLFLILVHVSGGHPRDCLGVGLKKFKATGRRCVEGSNIIRLRITY
jgi:hypothetical protein